MKMFIILLDFYITYNLDNLKYIIILDTKCFEEYVGFSNSEYAKVKLKEFK